MHHALHTVQHAHNTARTTTWHKTDAQTLNGTPDGMPLGEPEGAEG